MSKQNLETHVYWERMEQGGLPKRSYIKLTGDGSCLINVSELNDGWVRMGVDDFHSKKKKKRYIKNRRLLKKEMST